MPGRGNYALQPVFVEDLARMAVEASNGDENTETDAVGQEIYSYKYLLRTVRGKTGARCLILPAPKWLAYAAGRILGTVTGDIVITKDEIKGTVQRTAGVQVENGPARAHVAERVGWTRTGRSWGKSTPPKWRGITRPVCKPSRRRRVSTRRGSPSLLHKEEDYVAGRTINTCTPECRLSPGLCQGISPPPPPARAGGKERTTGQPTLPGGSKRDNVPEPRFRLHHWTEHPPHHIGERNFKSR